MEKELNIMNMEIKNIKDNLKMVIEKDQEQNMIKMVI